MTSLFFLIIFYFSLDNLFIRCNRKLTLRERQKTLKIQKPGRYVRYLINMIYNLPQAQAIYQQTGDVQLCYT